MDKPDRHPIYDCKFWIYEERRLASYEEYRDFYRRRVNGGGLEDSLKSLNKKYEKTLKLLSDKPKEVE